MSPAPSGQSSGFADSSHVELLRAKRRRSRWLHALLALLIFGSGAVTGGAVTVHLLKHHVHQVLAHPERAAELMTERLRREFDLTDAQFEQVRTILAERHGEFEQIRREVFPQVREVLDATHDDIAAVMDDQQREQWDQHYDYMIRTWFPPPPGEQPDNSS